jgi:hypothetical protein
MPVDHNASATWMEAKRDIIVLTNKSPQNFILDLPAGRYRLDAGRQMRTLQSILSLAPIKQLVDQGLLVVEKP